MDRKKKVDLVNTFLMKDKRNREADNKNELIPIEATIPRENQIKFRVGESIDGSKILVNA